MAATLSDAKKKIYREKFNEFDKNGDNKISKDELGKLLKKLHRNSTKAILMEDYDKNKSGFIEYDEFVDVMIKIDADIDKRLQTSFNEYDTQKDGFLSVDELSAAYLDMGIDYTKEELQSELKSVDLNADGKLNFEEFKKLFGHV